MRMSSPSPERRPANPLAEFLGSRSWQDWFLASALIIGTVALFRVRSHALAVHRSLIAGLLILTVLLLFRRMVVRLGGPMFLYDLFRTGRKGLGIGHRFLYGGFLLLALFLLYSAWFPYAEFRQLFDEVRMDPKQMPKFAAAFFGTFLCVQVGAVLLVTPAYVAGSIAEEKQRRTLEFVLTTDLSNREVVLGVLGARLANLALLLLTGLPVLSLLQFLGGVDPLMVFTGFVVTMLTMFSLAGQSMLASVLSRRPLDSIVGTYFVAFFTELVPTVIVLAAMMGSWDRFSEPMECMALILVCAIYHLGVGLGCCALAITSLRTAYLGTDLPPIAPPARPAPRVAEVDRGDVEKRKGAMRAVLLGEEIDGVPVGVPVTPVAAGERVRETRSPRPAEWSAAEPEGTVLEAEIADSPTGWPARPPASLRGTPVTQLDYPFRIRPPCGDEPILWKETGRNFNFSGIAPAHLRWVALILAAGYLVLFMISVTIQMVTQGDGPSGISNPMVRVLGTIGACVTLVLLALAGSSKISREKEQQTLEALLTTPLDSVEILFGKWLASVWMVSPIIVVLLLIWAMGVMTGGVHPASLPLVLGAYIVYVGCLSTLGLWLSMASRTTLRATLLSLLVAMVLVIGPGLLLRALEGHTLRGLNEAPEWYDLIAEYSFTPPVALWTLTFHEEALHSDPYVMLRIVAALFGLLVYMGATAVMWASMLRRLRESASDSPRSEGGGG